MTTTCTNPECPVPGLELPDGATTCWRCGASVDPVFDEETVKALDAVRVGRRAADMDELGDNSGVMLWFRKFAVGMFREARRPLVEEVARLRAELARAKGDAVTLARLAQGHCDDSIDLRAKLEAAERTANGLDEKLHSRDVELAELSAELERRQPVDREWATYLVEGKFFKYGICSEHLVVCAEEIVDVLGAVKAEPAADRQVERGIEFSKRQEQRGDQATHLASAIAPPAFAPSPTGEAPSEELVERMAVEGYNAFMDDHECPKFAWDHESDSRKSAERAEARAIYALIAADYAAQMKRVRELEKELGTERAMKEGCQSRLLALAVIVRGSGVALEPDSGDTVEKARLVIERLKAEASRPCPADAMDDETVGRQVSSAMAGYGDSPSRWRRAGAQARALFGKGRP